MSAGRAKMAVRARQVMNRAPADIQVTAEQILREAKDREGQAAAVPRREIKDPEELKMHRGEKRKFFEDKLRMQRQHLGTWFKYAKFEEDCLEFERARSVYERAIGVDYQSTSLWLRYASMEMRHKFVNRARNVWERAVGLLPRVSQFWMKYAYMEEVLGNREAARAVYERFMEWEPKPQGWMTYVNFEERGGDEASVERASNILERFLACHPQEASYVKVAGWEERHRRFNRARTVYERALAELDDDERTSRYYLKFAAFEERSREPDRVRVIFKYALESLASDKAKAQVEAAFLTFEKQHGSRQEIEDAVIAKRRERYEEEIAEAEAEAGGDAGADYDVFLDYAKLEEAQHKAAKAKAKARAKASGRKRQRSDGGSAADEVNADPAVIAAAARVRAVYERATSKVPPVAEKRYWKRYVYVWIMYAVWEELQADDPDRARAVYKACLGVIPHQLFTFGKIWILLAKLEVRQMNLGAARKVLGQALGKCPKLNIFNGYIDLEAALGEIGRCRKLFEKLLGALPEHAESWSRYAELEAQVGEEERARAIYELGTQRELDAPELLWKAYIDFEIANGEEPPTRARMLYERLLERTRHIKIWLSFAAFEAGRAREAAERGQEAAAGSVYDPDADESLQEALLHAREVFRRSVESAKEAGQKEERAMAMEAHLSFERWVEDRVGGADASETVKELEAKMPRRLKKRRQVYGEDGSEAGFEEYYDYIFAEDMAEKPKGLGILEAAQKWAATMGEEDDDEDDEDDDEDDDDDEDEEEDDDDDDDGE